MAPGFPTREIAEQELVEAGKLNNGKWIDHSRTVARAAEIIAKACGMDFEKAYILGLLHDIGRRIGFCGQKHIYAGYLYAMEKDWQEVARISLTHSFLFNDTVIGVSPYDGDSKEYEFVTEFISNVEYDDYDLLIQLCDALGNAEGFCIIEKRLVDVAMRYGEMPGMIKKWRKMFELKSYFDNKAGQSIYDLLPGIRDNL